MNDGADPACSTVYNSFRIAIYGVALGLTRVSLNQKNNLVKKPTIGINDSSNKIGAKEFVEASLRCIVDTLAN